MRHCFVLLDKHDNSVSAVIEADASLEDMKDIIKGMKEDNPDGYDMSTLQDTLENHGCTFVINPDTLTW